MALSLQEQLLKAGLADKKKAKQIKQAKHKQRKAKQKNNIDVVDQNKVAAEQAIEQKKARDRELNQQRQLEAEKKAIAAQIKQLIEVNKQPRGSDEVVCNFTDGSLVKRMHVSQAVNADISKGKLTIVKFADGYELVPTPVADKIAERDESVVVYRADDQRPESDDEDDWYADYKIPDDLTW
ncbi:DUF2058 domain-containing protein [Aestuariibacter salexigens]|uniref:DUF2058 domain-containing protein n=1 Tax=Aestuariibacter salexigens TaxID=226010 RepID=UPI00040746BA|nr:DUF2058 domain-containing protein [Aestuariibacter salexigens]